MDKKYRVILLSCLSAVAVLIVVLVILLLAEDKKQQTPQPDNKQLQFQMDSLEFANEKLQLTNEFTEIDADFKQYESRQVELKNDSIIRKYDEARDRVRRLLKELEKEKTAHGKSREKIKQLEAEIGTLRNICRHYLEEIDRLSKENTELKEANSQLTARNEELNSQVSSQTARNQELTQVVQRAEKLNVTGLSLHGYNKKGKEEKNVTKARKLGVSFRISPNNTAKPGMKDVYVRIISPEGTLLSGNGSFSYEGRQLPYTARRSVEYNNEELSTSVYWDVNTSLTPGEYTVEVFCDGNRLASRRFAMKK